MSGASQKPAFFHAEAAHAWKFNRYYRVYVLPRELIFLEAGPGDGNTLAAHFAIHGGLLGLLVGALIAKGMQKRTASRAQQLDQATEDELPLFLGDSKHNFRADFFELEDVRVEPRSGWDLNSNARAVGLLYFRHADQGKMKLQFLNAQELKKALQLLRAALGDKLTINAVWSEAKKKLVKGPSAPSGAE